MSSRVALPVLMWSISAPGAEEPPADPPIIELEVVTVTATKTERAVFEVPASVNLIGPERIESEGPQSINDLLEELPNVEVVSGPRRIGETVSIRGFDEERIVTTIDGARQNFNIGHQGQFFIEPDLLKEIEVYRGANSALYGSGAIGGVIALTTKDASNFLGPGEEFGARLKLGFQDANDEGLGGIAAYGRIGEDFEYLGNVTYRDSSDVELGNGDPLEDSAERSVSGLGKLTWRPAQHHRFLASIDIFKRRGDFPANPQALESPLNEVADTDIERNTYTVGYRYEDSKNPWVQVNVVAYRTELAEELRRESGYMPSIPAAPHVSCIGCPTQALRDVLATYRAAGINRIVALRGDLPSGTASYGELRYAKRYARRRVVKVVHRVVHGTAQAIARVLKATGGTVANYLY